MHLLIRSLGPWLLPALILAGSAPGAGATSAPRVRWQTSSGGTGDDLLFSVEQASDGGLFLAGASSSGVGGSKTAPAFGGMDCWVTKLSSNRVALWDRGFGGTADDGLFVVRQTTNGGCVLGGYSASTTNGNKTSPAFGLRDFWVIRLDQAGNKLWDRSFGGSRDDILYAIQGTPDGGFLCAGESGSGVSGNRTNVAYGGIDFWVVKITANGDKLWDKAYGGTGDDICYGLQVTADGGFVLAGTSNSGISGNKSTAGYGGMDFWVIRLDPNGNKQWEVTLGGTGDDGANSVSVLQTEDGGFLVGGDSASSPSVGKSSSNYGLEDFWVVKLDANGNKLWERSFGGAGSDYLTSLARSLDGSYLLAGGSESPSGAGKTSPNLGLVDLWLICIDGSGNKLWEQTYGGTDEDGFYNATVLPTQDGGLLLGGDSASGISGNKTEANFGGRDYWALKLDLVSPPRLQATNQTRIAQNGFHFFLQGEVNQSYLTEYSSDFLHWFPLSTNQLTAPFIEIIDKSVANVPSRSYRAREWP